MKEDFLYHSPLNSDFLLKFWPPVKTLKYWLRKNLDFTKANFHFQSNLTVRFLRNGLEKESKENCTPTWSPAKITVSNYVSNCASVKLSWTALYESLGARWWRHQGAVSCPHVLIQDQLTRVHIVQDSSQCTVQHPMFWSKINPCQLNTMHNVQCNTPCQLN